MASAIVQDTDYFDFLIKDVRGTFREKLAIDPDFFGRDAGVALRIQATLDEKASKGTLNVRQNLDIRATADILRAVDLTILDRDAKTEDVEQIAHRAAKDHCATVCVYPEHVPLVLRVMQEEGIGDVPPIAVVGFPSVPFPTMGATLQTVQQTRDAIASGAKEIDMVLPTSFREDQGNYQEHFKYLKAVIDTAHESRIPVKVILETAYLNDKQIAEAAILSKIAGADWVKTSTGFAEIDKFAKDKGLDAKGATPHVVALMRRAVGDTSFNDQGEIKPMGVKASGGVRNRDQAVAMLEAGADRIGASGSLDLRFLEKDNPHDRTSFQGHGSKPQTLIY